MPTKKTIRFDGYEVIDRKVKDLSNTGYAQVPKSWVGKKVSVVLLDPPNDTD